MREKIINYARAGYSGLYVVSHEERRVEAELKAAADTLGYSLYAWSITDGIIDASTGAGAGPQDPIDMLDAFGKLPEKSILVARDFHLFLREPNPVIIRKVKDALAVGMTSNRVFIALGCELRMLPELEKELTVVEFGLPDRAQLRVVIGGIADSAGIKLNGQTDAILDAASGLTTGEAANAAALSVVEVKDITASIVAREKAATIKKNGILEIVDAKTGLDEIGGLENLKAWVAKRKSAFGRSAREFGLPTPKGMLLLGVPGTGKSMTAKATAYILGVPLLKLDGGKIFGSLVGESERNLRSAIATAEAIAPCVLWVDELEKAFSGSKSSGATDGGTSARVFGTFLQWLQEKTSSVFVVATANDVSQLPPELLRKGRFDENWFVDLPTISERCDIWRIQIARFGRKPENYDIASLASATDGFTGAEIESLFSESLFAAFDAGAEPDTALLLSLSKQSVPLSKMMATEIEAMRQWAKGRARRATPEPAAVQAARKLGWRRTEASPKITN